MKRFSSLVVFLLASCGPGPSRVGVDQCELKEYLEECKSDLAPGTEMDNCRRKAKLEATRVIGGIAPECMPPGASK
jgi:hypothetical protein